MLNTNIKKIYEDLENNTNVLSSHLPESAIANLIKNKLEDENIEADENDLLEIASLSFYPEYSNNDSGWDLYYGPQWVLPVDGVMKEFPSIQNINKTSFGYWLSRLTTDAHSLLKVRYSDLIIELSPQIFKNSASYEVFDTHIEEVIKLLKDGVIMDLDLIRIGTRAYRHSLSVSNKKKSIELIKLMIQLEDKIFDIDKPGLWGFTLEVFFLENHKKAIISEEQLLGRIDKTEKVLIDTKDINPIDTATYLLMRYYAIKKDEVNLIRVIQKLEDIYRADERMNSEPLLAIHYLEKLRDIYTLYESRFPVAKAHAQRMLNEISTLDLDWEKSMKKISSEVTINVKEIRERLTPFFEKEHEDKLEITLSQLAVTFLPQEHSLREEMDKNIKKHPIRYLFTNQIIATDGTPLAKLSSVDNEYEAYFKKYVSDQLTMGSIVMSIAFQMLKEQFNEEEIIEHISSRLLFSDIKETLRRALEHYLKNNYLEFSYLVIPCIENAVRKLAKISGRTILKSNPHINGGFRRLLLNELLQDKELFQSTYGKFGENVQFYFKLVLTEQLGMNLRNDFAHGFEPKKFMSRNTAERLLHLTLCLALIVENESK
jgi:hypothetical protein